jgi:hypothetical protein
VAAAVVGKRKSEEDEDIPQVPLSKGWVRLLLGSRVMKAEKYLCGPMARRRIFESAGHTTV